MPARAIKLPPGTRILNEGVGTLLWQLAALGYETDTMVVLEHKFHKTRQWRFDMAFPDYNLAVEVDGGTWIGGRHTSGTGFEADCEKLSEAAALGWRVMRFTTGMVKDGRAINLLEKALSKSE